MNYEPTTAEVTKEIARLTKNSCLEFGKMFLFSLPAIYAAPTMMRLAGKSDFSTKMNMASVSGSLVGAAASLASMGYLMHLTSNLEVVQQYELGGLADMVAPLATNALSAGYEGIRALYNYAKDNLKKEKSIGLENRL